jgi:zinc transport system substrate-binding protein
MILRKLIFLFFISTSIYAKPYVLVSIAPQKFFVDQIAKGCVETIVLVPPGASPHSFEPTAKQLINASKSALWFSIGEPFEKKAINVLKSHNTFIQIVDTKKNITLLKGSCCHHCPDDVDTHIWLSPKNASIIASTIKEALVNKFPEKKTFFDENHNRLIEKLEALDQTLQANFAKIKDKTILVSHPAFGYLAKDYGFKQISIEVEGKDPTPKQLTELLKLAKSENIRSIYAQEQYQTKGAYIIAKAIKAQVIMVDPYCEDYINNTLKISLDFTHTHAAD